MASNSTRTVLIILACVAVVILAVCAGTVGVVVWGTREAVRFIGEEMEAERARQEFAASWQPPPADIAPEALFPEEVAGFRRASHDAVARVPDYAIDVPGRLAIYRADAAMIEVFAWQVSPLEAEALIRRVMDGIEERSHTYRVQSGSPESGRYRYTIRPPAETGYLWADEGWLFFLRTGDMDDLEPFLMDYLRSVEGQNSPSTNNPNSGG